MLGGLVLLLCHPKVGFFNPLNRTVGPWPGTAHFEGRELDDNVWAAASVQIFTFTTRSLFLGERSVLGWGEEQNTNILNILFLSGQKLKVHRDDSQDFLLPYLEYDWESYSLRFYGEEQMNMIFKRYFWHRNFNQYYSQIKINKKKIWNQRSKDL